MDRADFLKMLVAQLRAQDPLNPLSGQDFAAQLATFSSLQELQNIGSALDRSLDTNLLLTQTFSNTMASFLIGKIVTAESDKVQAGAEGDTTLSYRLHGTATSVQIDIRDSDGQLVRTLNMPAQASGNHSAVWDGLDGEGQRAAAGEYTFTVAATNAEGQAVGATTTIEGRVSEITFENGLVILIVGNARLQLGQVMSVRNPDYGQQGIQPW